jgi:hypothetical protein
MRRPKGTSLGVPAFFRARQSLLRKEPMRGILLWLIGIPIPIIILLWLFGVLH